MAFVSSYGDVEEGKRGATRARAAAAAEPCRVVPRRGVLACLVLSCLTRRDTRGPDQTRRGTRVVNKEREENRI